MHAHILLSGSGAQKQGEWSACDPVVLTVAHRAIQKNCTVADQGHFENWTNVEFCNLPNKEISNFVTSQGPRDLVSNVTTTSLLAVAWASSCYGVIDTFSVLATTGNGRQSHYSLFSRGSQV